jgi:hypothetical protein
MYLRDERERGTIMETKVLESRNERYLALAISALLDAAFDWDETPQGSLYWGEVYSDLRELAGDPE